MVFSSPVFLFVFLPVCLAFVLAGAALDRQTGGRPRAQNAALLVFSIAFYLYGSGGQIVMLFASIAVSWLCGLLIGRTRFRRAGLAFSVVGQLSVLGYFKYANFFVDQVNTVADALGLAPLPWQDVVLPVGVSFLVFHAISYTIDVYRQKAQPFTSPLDVALYLSLFPQLIAGPIVRYAEIADQIHARRARLEDIALGGTRFVFGLCKKVAVADAAGEIADAAFAVPLGEMSSGVAVIGAVAYTFQIYFDFSAYSDMALGLGRVFGLRFPENFNRPLTALSITDFWRRWHMTLSFWFRDYVYLPLGGSRGPRWRTYANLWTVFLLSGLWHGASWTFVVWGAYHGLLLTVERFLRDVSPAARAVLDTEAAPRFAAPRRALTFVLVVIGFTIFRAETFTQSLTFYRHMLPPFGWALPIDFAGHLTHKNLLFMGCAAASLFFPSTFVTGRWLEDARAGRLAVLARFVVLTAGALYASALIASNHFSPFIYFRF